MKKTIAIVAGGDSSEHDVSLRSAEGIYSFLDKERYEVYIIEIKGMAWEAHLKDGSRSNVDRNDFSFMEGGKRIRPDFAYITIHGTPGENGILQGYFDLIHLPYSTSDVLVEAMTFNKFTLNQYLKGFGVSVSESLIVRKGFEHLVTDDEIIEKIGLPCFVKPNAGGSSFGVTKVKSADQIHEAILKAMHESDEVMVEAFMEGTEISQGCYKTQEKEVVLPATEVVSDNEFFDYNAKYNGQVREITPARLKEETAERVSLITSMIYDILGCNGIIRVDYIITHTTDENGKEKERINMLEVNTTPGMTATSFIPQQVRAAGMDMKDVLTDIIENKLS
ncbi:MAG TPA: D-alanine--D-alanine ligase [Paraprevotella xylaniphila]|jgi:D-alanine-D-alanine ligase|uniref:D-alanine--D-alanine ligase n=2 Tax=Paraprevotella xylaniphila TaxID=454155 RepID=F3QRN5_9BACT|nr:D-alanine--D-alanine ligase [Paraprevotella xylaniphila]EGG55973.1 D-ala D-ala ligase protein [Paraprevotella xylaniphila YIT 11841]HAC42138.1 D-alanine--D-alanine ligase [Paraprevotella xylaniphila]